MLLFIVAKLRRVKDHEFPLAICLSWDMEGEGQNRLVLQENETGEIDVSYWYMSSTLCQTSPCF